MLFSYLQASLTNPLGRKGQTESSGETMAWLSRRVTAWTGLLKNIHEHTWLDRGYSWKVRFRDRAGTSILSICKTARNHKCLGCAQQESGLREPNLVFPPHVPGTTFFFFFSISSVVYHTECGITEFRVPPFTEKHTTTCFVGLGLGGWQGGGFEVGKY